MMFGTSVGALTRPAGRIGGKEATWRWVLAALAVISAPALTWAQVENVTPFYVAAEREGVALQCRIGSASYPVKVLKAGEVLKVDGQSQSIYRIEYPAGMSAFLKIEEAALEEGGKTAKLTKPSRLMAHNAEGGVSWWYLLEKELDAGTKLTVQKTVKGPDGKDSGYLVPAPAGSRGYIRRDFVRPATQGEIDAYLGKKTPETTPGDTVKTPEVAPTEPKPVAPTPAVPQPTPEPPPPGTPATPGQDAPGVTTTDVKPVEPPATAPGTTPSPTDAAQPEGAKPSPVKMKVVDAATLEKLFNEARKTTDYQELDTVIGEFKRAIGSLPADDRSSRVRSQLEVRLRALELRADMQAALRESTASSDALKQQADQMKAELERLDSLRQYTVVGRLIASSVYDGRQLPLMYRVLSPEPASTRTLAYIAPEANSDLTDKVGKLVGIVGESKLDESLRVNIVVPTRVEILGAIPSATPSIPSASPAATPAATPRATSPGSPPAPAPATPSPSPSEAVRPIPPIPDNDQDK